VYVAGQSWLLFPESYDGNTPLPVLFGFHGCGGGNRGDGSRTEWSDQTNNTAYASEYVRAIPLSSDGGGCWNYNTDIARVKAFYDDLVNNYCVDLDHVFATGHSSGAQFIQQMLLTNHTADAEHFNFRGVAPVASSNYGAHGTAVAVMYIQSQNDKERGGNGKDAVDRFVAGNMCSSSSMPYTADGAGCNSGGTTVNPGCVSYNDCDVPTVWCSHNDPQYSGTGHGVPCFWAKATDEFFKSLD
jgi:poly(3-hydroxybutyrate) depolymerase